MKKITKRKSTKITNTTNLAANRQNDGTWDSYRNILSRETKLVNKTVIKEIADELVDWAQNPKSRSIERFYLSRGIPKQTFYRWVEKYDFLQEALMFALEICGMNREEKAEEERATINHVIAFPIPHYLSRWRDQMEWRASMKAKMEHQHSLVQNPVIQDYIFAGRKELEQEIKQLEDKNESRDQDQAK